MSSKTIITYILKNQIIFALLIIFFIWVIITLKAILITFFTAYILLTAVLPLVKQLEKRRIPKVIAVIIVYLGIVAVFALLVAPIIPFLFTQFESLTSHLPQTITTLGKFLKLHIDNTQIANFVSSQLGAIGANTVLVTSNVLGSVFSLLTVIVISFYLLLDYDRIKRGVSKTITFYKSEKEILKLLNTIEQKLGAWVRGQLLLCLIIGLASYIAYSVLRLPYALPLALLASFLEIIPTIGPLLGAIPAILVAITISPTLTLFVILAYFMIQTLESNFLVPKIMQHAVGLHPLLIICAIIIGGELLGITGALLAVPIASLLLIIFLTENK